MSSTVYSSTLIVWIGVGFQVPELACCLSEPRDPSPQQPWVFWGTEKLQFIRETANRKAAELETAKCWVVGGGGVGGAAGTLSRLEGLVSTMVYIPLPPQ